MQAVKKLQKYSSVKSFDDLREKFIASVKFIIRQSAATYIAVAFDSNNEISLKNATRIHRRAKKIPTRCNVNKNVL